MAFNSYMEFKKALDAIGFSDVILGVKDTIQENTVYISLASSKKTGSDDFSWVIGYTYNIVASVPDADSSLIKQLSEILSSALTFNSYSDSSHLYIFSGQIYLPVGQKGEAWE